LKISPCDLERMPQRYRAHFINSLTGFKSANLLGTISASGVTNLAMISSAFHLGADPALLGFICRPPSVPRHSLINLRETGFFTLNHCHETIFRQAHQTSARYPRTVSEFAATGLTEEYSDTHPAPYVAESRIKLGLKSLEEITIQRNETVLVIGEIVEVLLPEDTLGEDGHVHIELAESLCVSGLDHYHQTHSLGRLPYAKP